MITKWTVKFYISDALKLWPNQITNLQIPRRNLKLISKVLCTAILDYVSDY